MAKTYELEVVEMKKIGIITLNGDNNYGNRLQNYALEQSINHLGYDVETIVFPNKKNLKDYLRLLKKNLRSNYRIEQKKFKKMNELKSQAFKPFRQQYLHNKRYERADDFSCFDRFITGSDQVWNPSWHLIDDNWLRFVPKEKRFSYAASMATTTIHKNNINKLPQYLNEMNELSVREAESVDFIRELTGREAKLVIDPTMLLSKNDYEMLIENQKDSQVDTTEPYILIYSLVGLTDELEVSVNRLAQKNNLKIIRVMGNKFHNDHIVFNPIEFVEAIQNASLVISDSFHCGVFSILMETQFVLFNRTDGQQMSSRITTLLEKFDLMSQFYQNGELEELMNIDFTHINEKLIQERKDGIDYLKYILSKPI